MLDKFLPRTAPKVDQSSTDVVQKLPLPENMSVLYFLPAEATAIPKEKPIPKLKNAVSGCKAASCSRLKDGRFSRAVACQSEQEPDI